MLVIVDFSHMRLYQNFALIEPFRITVVMKSPGMSHFTFCCCSQQVHTVRKVFGAM